MQRLSVLPRQEETIMATEGKDRPVLRMPHPAGLRCTPCTPSVVWWNCVEAFIDAEIEAAYERGRLAGREELKKELRERFL